MQAIGDAMSSVLLKHGYMATQSGVVPKPFRPKTLGDARQLITDALARQPWDEDAVARYFAMKGSAAKTVAELTGDDVRRILAEMERSRIVIFQD